MTTSRTPTSPLYRDPVEDGAADPVVVWNPHEQAWWLFYTNRRTTAPNPEGIAWLFGSAIGVASSADGERWDYRGTVQGLDVEWGHNTFWAPEIVEHDGTFHMYVSYIRGIPAGGDASRLVMRHYSSRDLVEWRHHGVLDLGTDRVIDACVVALPTGGWRMWFKHETTRDTWSADSDDLVNWTPRGRVVSTPGGHEGPNVFRLGGWWWLIVDTWAGQATYRSNDLDTWEARGTILAGAHGRPFSRTDDVGPGLHADVVVDGAGRAWIFYFTHPSRVGEHHPTVESRRSSVLVAALTIVDGDLVCDRDAEVTLRLEPPRAS